MNLFVGGWGFPQNTIIYQQHMTTQTTSTRLFSTIAFAIVFSASAFIVVPQTAFADCAYGQFCESTGVIYDDSGSDWYWDGGNTSYNNTYNTHEPNDWYWDNGNTSYLNTYNVNEPVSSYPATVAYEPSYTYEPSYSYNPSGGYSNSYVNFSTGYPSYSNPNYTYINSSYPTIPSYNSGYTYTYQSDYVYDYTVVHHDNNDNNNDNDPSCELDASDRSVEEGDRITLTWDTEDADYASINQGIGRVDEDGGSERVRIEDNDDITFRMTVRNEDGEDTCSVTVRVGDNNENDFSNVTFYGEGTNNPPTVYLSSLPYTGLEDVAPQTYAYLLLLVAGIAWGGYMLFTRARRTV